MNKDLYSVLGITRTASADVIKKAYKTQAMKWHPDRNMSNETEAKEQFQSINEAFETLSDPSKRALYDLTRTSGSRPLGPFARGMGFFRSDFDPSHQYFSFNYPDTDIYYRNSNNNDFPGRYSTNSMFPSFTSHRNTTQQQSRQQQSNYQRNNNHQTPLSATEPNKNNSRKRARFASYDPRTSNHSNNPTSPPPSHTFTSSHTASPPPPPAPGFSPYFFPSMQEQQRPSTSTSSSTSTPTPPAPAPAPFSSIPTPAPSFSTPTPTVPTPPQPSSSSSATTSTTTPKKKAPASIKKELPVTLEDLYVGITKRLKVTRKMLQGTRVEKILTVNIPPGCRSGTKISFPGEGDELEDGHCQDIDFIVDELPHQSYARQGDSLHVTVNLTLIEALSGFNKEIPALDQTMVPLTSNTTIQPGQRIRLNRRGMPNPETGRKGDLLVTYNVILPVDLSETQKQIVSDTLSEQT